MPSEFPEPTWEEFLQLFRPRWKQGEHVFISAQTGAGKTDLEIRLLSLETRKHSVALITKPQDPILRSPLTKGWKRAREFRPDAGWRRVMLAPPKQATTRATMAEQYAVFANALDTMYHQRGWTVGVDELAQLTSRLRLGPEIGDAHFTGRALGLTFVSCTQRPKHIPVIVPQSASHAFLGKTGRRDDLNTLAELGGDVAATRRAIGSLRGQHDFVYVDTQGQLPVMIVNTRRGLGRSAA